MSAGAGDVAGLVITFARPVDPLPDIPAGITLESLFNSWTSDALYLGFSLSLISALVCAFVWSLRRAVRVVRVYLSSQETDTRTGAGDDPSHRGHSCDIPHRCRDLGVIGLLPMVALAFIGGADAFVDPSRGTTLAGAVSDLTLYPRLRPKPVPSTRAS